MIRLTVLGGLGLADPDGQSIQPVLSQPKRVAVLAYLALAGPGGFRRRDTALGFFWPDAKDERARRALNQTLHFLRQSLGAEAIVSRGPGELGVSADALWCDAVAFDQMIKSGDLVGALHLYRGELLPGFFTDAAPEFDQWLSSERARLQRMAFAAAWKLAESTEKDGQFAAAADWGRKAVELSLNDETTARSLIQLLDRIGDRAGALQAYDSFAARLAREYETRPSAEMREIVAQIRTRPDVRPQAPQNSVIPEAITQHPGVTVSTEEPTSKSVEDRGSAVTPAVTLSVETGGATDGSFANSSRAPNTARRSRRYWLSAGALAASLGVFWIYFYGNVLPASRSGADEQRASIIVRELANAGPRGDSLHLEQALTSAIVDQLTQVRSFNVIAIPTKGAVQTRPASGGAAPRVLVTGNVVYSGPQVRVNIQIADAETGRTIKTAALDHPSGELLSLVDSLSLQVSSLVRTAVGREVRLREWSRDSKNANVFALMQAADEHRDRASQLAMSGDFPAAVRALQSADSTLLDVEQSSPGWREPMIERAEVLQTLGAIYLIPLVRNPVKVKASLARGIVEARRAVAVKPNDASALEALGSVEYWYWLAVPLPVDSAQFTRARAEASLRAAVIADPGRASAWSLLSTLLYARADYVGAYLTADRAYRADAYLRSSETILDALFLSSYEMGDGSTSAYWCGEINRRIGRGWLSAYCRLRLLSLNAGKDNHAIARAWRVAQEADDPANTTVGVAPQLQMLVAVVIAQHGLRDSAEAVIRNANERGKGDPELVSAEAEARMRLGQPDSATALLTGYLTARPSHRAGIVRSRTFAELTQFQQTLTRMGIPQSTRN